MFGLFALTVLLVGAPAYIVTDCVNNAGLDEKSCIEKVVDERTSANHSNYND